MLKSTISCKSTLLLQVSWRYEGGFGIVRPIQRTINWWLCCVFLLVCLFVSKSSQ
jgi:hypothetical protein